jgi:hypothetical protein
MNKIYRKIFWVRHPTKRDFSLNKFHRYGYKKENKIFFIFKEIQNGAVSKSYMTNGLLVYGEIFVHLLIY